MRFVLRLVGFVFLALGIVFAVGDIARSIANEATRLMTINEALPSMGIAFDTTSTGSQTLAVAGHWSIAITCGVIGLVCLLLGRKPRARRGLR
ncbi:hypothetical protein [Jiella sp. M17.18]|uniref:hypothetical protein n=1 Tax=Jiella sp. M17.18 TaxID=3234247 RepID=UPI0034DFC727